MKARIDKYGEVTVVNVTLSVKNLLDLTAQAIANRPGGPVLHRAQDDLINLTVGVQPNDEHYEDRVAGPGSGLV